MKWAPTFAAFSEYTRTVFFWEDIMTLVVDYCKFSDYDSCWSRWPKASDSITRFVVEWKITKLLSSPSQLGNIVQIADIFRCNSIYLSDCINWIKWINPSQAESVSTIQSWLFYNYVLKLWWTNKEKADMGSIQITCQTKPFHYYYTTHISLNIVRQGSFQISKAVFFLLHSAS